MQLIQDPQLQSFEKLLVLLTYLQPTESEKSQIRDLFKKVENWESFFDLMKFNKTLPLSYYRLKEEGLWGEVPERIQNSIEEIALKVKVQNQARIDGSLKFLTQFKTQGIPVALLKGIALAESIYHNPFYKRMNDIDILIHKEDLKRIFKIYESLHYFSIEEPTSGGPEGKEKSDPVSFVAPVFVSQDMSTIIGTQWGIKSPATGYKIDYPGIWARMRPVHFHGLDLLMLSAEDALHHLCLHLGFFKISVRDIMDLYNLLRYESARFNWAIFKSQVAQSGSENPVYFSLSLANAWCPMPEVEAYLDELRPKVSHSYQSGTARKVRDRSLLIRLSTDYFQSVEKNVIRFNSEDRFLRKLKAYLRIWSGILWPPRADVNRMCVLSADASIFEIIKARMMAPYWVFWVIASEIGWVFLCFLVLKLDIDLVSSLWKRPGKSYAERIGVAPELLKKLQEHFE